MIGDLKKIVDFVQNEKSTQSEMNYKTKEGKIIKISYEVKGTKAYFNFLNKDKEEVEIILTLKRNVQPEDAIFNWLKSIDY